MSARNPSRPLSRFGGDRHRPTGVHLGDDPGPSREVRKILIPAARLPRSMAEGASGEPIDLMVKSARDLLRPEELVREATRDLVKDEIRRHLEKTLQENPKLAQDLKDAVRDLLEARAREYAAVLRVGAATARLGLSALPPDVRRALTEDLVELVSKELGNIAERSL